MSGLRSIAASEGFTIEASELGKFKMVVQIVSVVAVILDHRWKEWPIYSHYIFPIHWIAYLAIWFMVCVSLVSAIDYFVAFWSKIDRRVVKRRRRAFILSRRRKPVPAAAGGPRCRYHDLVPLLRINRRPSCPRRANSRTEERSLLLRLAHDAILSALEQREISLEPPTPHLAEHRGAFTSLYLHGQLRGCVGYVLPVSPVYRAVAETARAAAFEDTRFSSRHARGSS